MALSQELQNKLNAFNSRYGIQFDLENMERNRKTLSSLNNLTIAPQGDKMKNAEVYFTMVKDMLVEVLDNKTNIAANAEYGVGDFNIERFVNDMEDLIQQKHLEDNDKKRKAFGGLKYKDFIEMMHSLTRPYNQSIYLVWSYRLFQAQDENFINSLKNVTNTATASIDNGLNDRNYQRSDLANVVYAQRALEMVRGSRTGWWKFWHPIHNYRERKYYEALTSKVEEYTKANLPIDSILEETEELLLRNAYEKFERPKVDAKHEAETNKNLTNEEILNKIISAPDTMDELVGEIKAMLPEGSSQPSMHTTFLGKGIIPDVIKEIKGFNKNFTNETKDGKTVETQMVEFLGSLYEKLNITIGMLSYDKKKDNIVAIQTIIDVTMKKISPVAIYPDSLGQYAEGYILNNAKQFKKVLDVEMNSEDLKAAQEMYVKPNEQILEDERMNVNMDNIINKDDNMPKSEPVEQSISNPNKEISIN